MPRDKKPQEKKTANEIPEAHLREEKRASGEETGEQPPEDYDTALGGDPASRRHGEAAPGGEPRPRRAAKARDTQQGGGGIGGTEP